MSMGTSSSEVVEVVSSDSGISSTSSSEDDEEKDGEPDSGREVLGEALNREILRPSVWKMEAREGLLGGTETGRVWAVSANGAGGAYGGGGGEAEQGGEGGGRGGGRGAPCCCSVCTNKPSF